MKKTEIFLDENSGGRDLKKKWRKIFLRLKGKISKKSSLFSCQKLHFFERNS